MAERWKYILEFGEQRFSLADQPSSIGRSRKCEVAISDPSVSRRHAVLTAQEGLILLEDLGSSNGTFVNGERVQGSIHLRTGDVLALGDAEIRVYVIAAGGLETVRLPAGGIPPELADELPVGEATSFLQEASVRLAREALGEANDESMPSVAAAVHMAPPPPPVASSPVAAPPAAAPPAIASPPMEEKPVVPPLEAPVAPLLDAHSDLLNPLQTAQFNPAMLQATAPESPLQTMHIDSRALPGTAPDTELGEPPEDQNILQTVRFDPGSLPVAAAENPPRPENPHQTTRFDPVAMGLVPPAAPSQPASIVPVEEVSALSPSGLGTEAADVSSLEVSEPSGDTEPQGSALPGTPIAEIPTFEPAALPSEMPSFDPLAIENSLQDGPVFEAPSFETPTFEVPVVDGPVFEAPSFETPTFETPSFETPSFEPPSFEPPAADAPVFEAPSFETPSLETPTFETPVVDAPVLEALPSFEAPPSFETPPSTPLDDVAVQPASVAQSPALPASTLEGAGAQQEPAPGFGFEAPFAGSSMEEPVELPSADLGPSQVPVANFEQKLAEIPSLGISMPGTAAGDIRDLAAHQSADDSGFGGDMLSSLEGFDTTLGPDAKLPESMQRAQEQMEHLRHEGVAVTAPVNPYIPAPPASRLTPGRFEMRALALVIDAIWMGLLYFGFKNLAGPINAELGPQMGEWVVQLTPVVLSLFVVLVGWSVWGSTPGKRVCGLVIVDAEGKAGLGVPRAFLRLVGYAVSIVLGGLGFLMALGTSRRALQDVLAGSQVVKR